MPVLAVRWSPGEVLMDYSDASGCFAETPSSPWPPDTTSLHPDFNIAFIALHCIAFIGISDCNTMQPHLDFNTILHLYSSYRSAALVCWLSSKKSWIYSTIVGKLRSWKAWNFSKQRWMQWKGNPSLPFSQWWKPRCEPITSLTMTFKDVSEYHQAHSQQIALRKAI